MGQSYSSYLEDQSSNRMETNQDQDEPSVAGQAFRYTLRRGRAGAANNNSNTSRVDEVNISLLGEAMGEDNVRSLRLRPRRPRQGGDQNDVDLDNDEDDFDFDDNESGSMLEENVDGENNLSTLSERHELVNVLQFLIRR